ncbi:hypothetical protein Gotur_014330 [Gossypium turneri]
MGDSKTVIKKSQTTTSHKSMIGAIIKDIQNKKFYIQDLTFQDIHISDNTHAHNLAKKALAKGDGTYLMGEELEHHISILEGEWQMNPD